MPKSLSSIIRVENRLNARRKAFVFYTIGSIASATIFFVVLFLICLQVGIVKICF